MTGSHEVRGSIPLGSTKILLLRYPSTDAFSSYYLHFRAHVVCDAPALPVLTRGAHGGAPLKIFS